MARHFDPEIVDIFLENFYQFLEIRERYSDFRDEILKDEDEGVFHKELRGEDIEKNGSFYNHFVAFAYYGWM